MKPVRTLVLALALTMLGALPGLAAGEITVNGGGWGHGIGMSQYGAQALATQGKTAAQITAHFYSGSSIGITGQGAVTGHPDPVLVGVAQRWNRLDFQPVGGAVQVCLGSSPCGLRGTATGQAWSVRVIGSGVCRVYSGEAAVGASGPCVGQITWGNQPNTRVTLPALGRTYARGKIVFSQVPSTGTRIHVNVQVTIEQYLYGLAEMPSSWHVEALKAQAIAGRTYAVQAARARNPISAQRMEACACHLYATTQDQAYVGWAKEGEANGWGPRWKSAVDATAKQVVIHPSTAGRAIESYYFSATGGRTEDNEDMWGGTPRPYLRSVPDPGARKWSAFGDPAEIFTKSTFASKLGFSSVWSAQIATKFSSGSPASVKVTGVRNGATATQSFTGTQLKTLLGLRSHYVTSITGFLPASFANFVEGDFDGDNIDETAAFSTVDGSWWVFDKSGSQLVGRPFAAVSRIGWARVVSGDFNADGRTDVAMFNSSTGAWWVGVSSGTKFNFKKWATFPTRSGWSPQLVGDFNGDGRDDIANYFAANGTWWVAGSTGTSFSTRRWITFGSRTGWQTHLVGDFNGDQRDDLASYHLSNGSWWVSRSTGSAFSLDQWADFSSPGAWSNQVTGDFNEDGRDDIASYHQGSGAWWVSRSTGAVFSTKRWVVFGTKTGWAPQLVGDFNGDGRDDIASFYTGNGTWWVSKSTGTAFSTNVHGSLTPATGWSGQMAGDFDGDGADELSNYYNGNRSYWMR